MRYPELRDLEAWITIDEARRRSIAEEVASEHGLVLERIAPFRSTDLPLASFRGLDDLFRFVLLPGGSYERGCSDLELSRLEALALPLRDAASEEEREAFEETWGTLFSQLDTMRPVEVCSVGPLLAAQTPLGDFSPRSWRREIGNFFVGEQGDTSGLPPDLEEGLRMFGYRLPTEIEWEWLARGGRSGELTYRGSEIDLLGGQHRARVSADLREAEGKDEGDRHAGISNDFGLTAFGLLPELCADRYQPALGAPFETTPKLSERTVRGGAGVAFGQNRGEWHAFLTAHRQPGKRLASEPGLRLVRDVEPR